MSDVSLPSRLALAGVQSTIGAPLSLGGTDKVDDSALLSVMSIFVEALESREDREAKLVAQHIVKVAVMKACHEEALDKLSFCDKESDLSKVSEASESDEKKGHAMSVFLESVTSELEAIPLTDTSGRRGLDVSPRHLPGLNEAATALDDSHLASRTVAAVSRTSAAVSRISGAASLAREKEVQLCSQIFSLQSELEASYASMTGLEHRSKCEADELKRQLGMANMAADASASALAAAEQQIRDAYAAASSSALSEAVALSQEAAASERMRADSLAAAAAVREQVGTNVSKVAPYIAMCYLRILPDCAISVVRPLLIHSPCHPGGRRYWKRSAHRPPRWRI